MKSSDAKNTNAIDAKRPTSSDDDELRLVSRIGALPALLFLWPRSHKISERRNRRLQDYNLSRPSRRMLDGIEQEFGFNLSDVKRAKSKSELASESYNVIKLVYLLAVAAGAVRPTEHLVENVRDITETHEVDDAGTYQIPVATIADVDLLIDYAAAMIVLASFRDLKTKPRD